MSTKTQESTNAGGGNFDPDDPRMSNSYYISALKTKRNPDLIIPGGPTPLKGNLYFRKVGGAEEKNDNNPESEAEKTSKT